jgi:peptidoglycan-associated lipoprotein
VYLRSHPESRIAIQGHCDERGTNNYNLALSERRALSARAYLISQGIDESRVHVVGLGEEQPFCFDSNEKCWYQNRRAHFLIADQ